MIDGAARVWTKELRVGSRICGLLVLVRCMGVGPVGAMTIYLTCYVPIQTIKLVWSPFMTGFFFARVIKFLVDFFVQKVSCYSCVILQE